MDAYDPPVPIREKFPATLPLELALGIDSVRNICESYGISKEEWDNLREDPRFVKAVESAVRMLEKEGMSFRVKARMQAEELLKTCWNLIHRDDVPAAVKADLIKSTVKWADYEPKVGVSTTQQGGFSVSIVLAPRQERPAATDAEAVDDALEGTFARVLGGGGQ